MRSSVVVAVLLVGLAIAWLMGGFADHRPATPASMPHQPKVPSTRAVAVEGSTKRERIEVDPAKPEPDFAVKDAQVAVVIGRVLNAGSQPVVGAKLALSLSGGARPVRGVATQDGTFHLEAQAVGAAELVVSEPSTGFARREGLRVAHGVLDVGDVVLQSMQPLRCRLVYPDGRPITGLKVTASNMLGSLARPNAGVLTDTAETDGSGRMEILSLAEGTYQLKLPCLTFPDEREPSPRVVAGHAPQDVTVARHRILVLGEPGSDVDGWRAERAGDLQTALRTGRGWRELLDTPDVSATSVTAIDAYSDFLVSYGSSFLLSNSDGDKWAEKFVHADSTRNETEVDLTMKPIAMSGTLRLRARAADGSVPKDAKLSRIYANGLNSPGWFEAAGRDGDDFLFRITPGSYRVTIRMGLAKSGLDVFGALRRDIEIKAEEETLVTSEAMVGGRVQLTLHLPDNEVVRRVPGLQVSSLGQSGELVPLRPYQAYYERGAERGYSRGSPPSETPFICVRMLPPGRHELTVVATGYQPQRLTAFVEVGKVASLEVWLTP